MVTFDDIKRYVELSQPIPFCGFSIPPIKVKDSYDFNDFIEVFEVDKNSIPDVKIIRMPYLEFLMSNLLIDKGYMSKFLNLLKLILGVEFDRELLNENFGVGKLLIDELGESIKINGYNIFFSFDGYEIFIVINSKRLTWEEFDDFIEIIKMQNLKGYDNTQMSDDFKRVVSEYYNLKNKNIIAPNLGFKISVVMSNCSYTEAQIMDMTYFRFEEIFDIILDRQEYQIAKQAEFFGTKFEKAIEHWVYKNKGEKYADAFASLDSYKGKIQQAGASE